MPLGLIRKVDAVEAQVELSTAVTGSASGTISSCSIESMWFANSVDPPLLGYRAQLGASQGGFGSQHTWSWVVPSLGISESDTDAGYTGAGSVGLIFHDVRLYIRTDLKLELRVAAVDLTKDGDVVMTLDNSGAGWAVVGDWVSPAGIPIFGVPGRLEAGAGQSLEPSDILFDTIDSEDVSGSTVLAAVSRFIGAPDGNTHPIEDPLQAQTYAPCAAAGYVNSEPYTGSAGVVVVATASGGWRTKIGSHWLTPPVTVPELAWGGGPCDGSMPPMPALEADDTWSGVVSSRYAYSESGSSRSKSSTFATLTLLPHLVKTVERLEPDVYRALVVRAGFPKAESVLSHICKSQSWGSGVGAETSFQFPRITAHADQVPYLTHQDADYQIATYINTWASPHWSFFLWVPAESGGSEYQWPVNGGPAQLDEYWGLIMQQQIKHPALPGGENRQTRVDVMLEPIYWGALTPLVEAGFIANGRTTWWGCERPIAIPLEWEPSTSPPASTGARWSVEGASADYGSSGITLTPSEADVMLEYDLASWSAYPYLHPLAAPRILAAWSTANIDSGALYAVGADGRETLITKEPLSEPVLRPQGRNRKYAGTWAQDYGAGFVEVLGEDLIAGRGSSAASMADPDRVLLLQLVHAYGASKIRYRFKWSGAGDIEVDYPEFHAPEDPALVLPETSQFGPILYPDAAGFRWGNLTWWSTMLGHINPPEPLALGTPHGPPTALDMMSWRRLVYEARAYDDDIAGEISALFDENDLASPEDLFDYSHFFAAPIGDHGTAVVVPWLSCVPPQPCVLGYALDGDLQPTEDVELRVWSHIVEPKYYVEPDGMHLQQPGDPRDTWTVDSEKEVDGWAIREHSHAVDGSELAGFFLVKSGRDWASTTPWHGSFGSLSLLPRGVHACRAPHGPVFAAIARDDGVDVVAMLGQEILDEFRAWDVEGPTDVQIALRPDGTLLLAVVAEGPSQVWLLESASWARDWSSPVALTQGEELAVAVDEGTGDEYVAVWSDGEFRLHCRRQQGGDWEDRGLIVEEPEPQRAGLEFSPLGDHPLVFVLSGDPVRRWMSVNRGQSWDEIA